ncbi:MAG TPA: hypothetical protein VMB05_12925 [Solirubrobacteraceae bacterium]|nr:hypothetical protein [Solirubrobacteraceae bacterium]HUB72934.1 hypothetical protein [Solirubrobacteraceae bacterium]
MNSKTSKRANHCQQKRAAQRPWLERGPFLAADGEPDELDESWDSERLDALLEEDTDIDLEDFLDHFD